MNDGELFAFELECIARILRGEGTKLDFELFPPTTPIYEHIARLEIEVLHN